MIFQGKGVAKITAGVTGSKNKITIAGVTASSTTPENAKAQIDKILGIVNKSVQTAGMTRTVTEEAVDNG